MNTTKLKRTLALTLSTLLVFSSLAIGGEKYILPCFKTHHTRIYELCTN